MKLRSRQSADVEADIGALKETREEVGPQQQLRPAAQEKATGLITDDAAANVPAWPGTEVGERLQVSALFSLLSMPCSNTSACSGACSAASSFKYSSGACSAIGSLYWYTNIQVY